MKITITEESLQDIINIETGLLSPLTGFMNVDDYREVVDNCRLSNGEVFTIPITLDIPREIWQLLKERDNLFLQYNEKIVAKVEIQSKFMVTDQDIEKVFKTLDEAHPGVKKEKQRSPYRVGGTTCLQDDEFFVSALKPEETKAIFKEKGWNSIVGFQTRNPIHKAHEHLQRAGLEVCDGLFINPIVGWKKIGDFTEEAVIAGYTAMKKYFYPKDRVYMAGLKTQMRYAGPREAIFHAIIRRNLGCTHFIIGRDHAGVGGYYGSYEAHELARELMDRYNLGIELLLMNEPYYCKKCGQVVTNKHCSHYDTNRVEISGTIIRKYINEGYIPDEIMMRKEVFEAILSCNQIFIS